MVAPARRRLQADNGVSAAIQSLIKQQKFARMFVFALRQLSQFCNPSRKTWKENALSVLYESGLEPLVAGMVTFANTAEVLSMGAGIIHAITEGIRVEDRDSLKDFVNSRGMDAVMASVGADDEEALQCGLKAIRNLELCGEVIPPEQYASKLLGMFRGRLPKPTLAEAGINAMLAVAAPSGRKLDSGVELLHNEGVPALMLTYAGQISQGNKTAEVSKLIGSVMRLLSFCPPQQEDATEAILLILERNRGVASIEQYGADLLAKVVTTDMIKDCIKDLKEPMGTPKKNKALSMLACLSYIGSCADTIAKAGGIPAISDAINDCVGQLDDPATRKGIIGAVMMMKRIAQLGNFTKELIDADIGNRLACILKVGAEKKLVDVASAAVSSASALAYEPTLIGAFSKAGGVKAAKDVFSTSWKEKSVAAGCSELFATVSTNPDILEVLKSGDSLCTSIFSGVIPEFVSEITIAQNLIKTLTQLISTEESVKDLVDEKLNVRGQLEVICKEAMEDVELAADLSRFFKASAGVPDASEKLSGNGFVPLILKVVIQHSSRKEVRKNSLAALEGIATEKDVHQCVSDLQNGILSAKTNTNAARDALSAVNGLGFMSRLAALLHKKNVTETIVEGCRRWADWPFWAQEQLDLIAIACGSICRLVTSLPGPLNKTFMQVLGLATQPKIKGLCDKQNALATNTLQENSLIHFLDSAAQICRIQRFEPPHVDLVDNVVTVMKKYPDQRIPQMHCITCLTDLLIYPGVMDYIVSENIMKQVVMFTNRVIMFAGVQEASWKFMQALLTLDPEVADRLRACGATETAQKAMRTHKGKAAGAWVEANLMPVYVMLTPYDELERLIIQNCNDIKDSLNAKNPDRIKALLSNLNSLISSQDGQRCAARVGAAKVLVDVAQYSVDIDDIELMAECSGAVNRIASQHRGCQVLNQGKVMPFLIAMFERLKEKENDQATQGQLDNLQAQGKLMRAEKDNLDIAYKKGMFASACFTLAKMNDRDLCKAAANYATAFDGTGAFKEKSFSSLVDQMLDTVTSQDMEAKMVAISALNELAAVKDARGVINYNRGTKRVLEECGVNDREFNREAAKFLNSCTTRPAGGSRSPFKDMGLGSMSVADVLKFAKPMIEKLRDDPDALADALRFVANCVSTDDEKTLKAAGFPQLLEDILSQNDNAGVCAAAAEIQRCCGAAKMIAELIKKINDELGMKKPSRLFNGYNTRLQVLLSVPIEGAEKSLKDAVKTVELFGDYMDKATPEEARAMIATSRRLAEQDKGDDPWGMTAMAPKLLPAIMKRVADMSSGAKPFDKQSFVEAVPLIRTALRKKPIGKDMQDAIASSALIPATRRILKDKGEDVDVALAAMNLLRDLLVDQEDGLPAETESLVRKNYPKDEMIGDIVTSMSRHRANPEFMAAAMATLAAAIVEGQKPPAALTPQMMKELESAVKGDPEALGALIRAQRKLMPSYEDPETRTEIAGRLMAAVRMIEAMPMFTAAQKNKLNEELAGLMGMAGFDAADNSGGIEKLLENVESGCCLPATLRQLKKLAEENVGLTSKLAAKLPNLLVNSALAVALCDSPEAVKAVTGALLNEMESGGEEGVAAVAATPNLEAKLAEILKAAAVGSPIWEAIKMDVEKIKDKAMESPDEELTLEILNGRWKDMDDHNMSENPLITKHLMFQINQTQLIYEDRGKWSASHTKGLGREFFYGVKNYQLLLGGGKDNIRDCINHDVHSLLIGALHRCTTQELVAEVATAAEMASRTPQNSRTFADVENAKHIVSNCLQQGVQKHVPAEDISNRLQLLENLLDHPSPETPNMAHNKLYYNGTHAMESLLSIWDSYDDGQLPVDCIIKVFACMRKMINNHWVSSFIEKRQARGMATSRLIEYCRQYTYDDKSDIRALPNVCFLMGVLAFIPELKVIIGEGDAVEALLDLIYKVEKISDLRQTKDPNAGGQYFQKTGAVANACIALSSITLNDSVNIARFLTTKPASKVEKNRTKDGIHKTVETMQKAIINDSNGKEQVEYDVAMGAASLMTNISFKRDPNKEKFGDAGAPAAILNVVERYDGSTDMKAVRCLKYIFGAIGNQGLYPKNANTFLSIGVIDVFVKFLQKSTELPDDVIEVSLKTLSNLTMENDAGSMEKAGVIIEPIIKYVLDYGMSTRQSPHMFGWAFEALGFMIRDEKNEAKFNKAEGIKAVIKVAEGNADPYCRRTAIYCLGVSALQKRTLKVLVDNGIFKFLTATLVQQTEGTEILHTVLLNTCLRCIKRCLTTKEFVAEFCDSGGINAIISVLQREDADPMVHNDGHKVLIACLLANPNAQLGAGSVTNAPEVKGDMGMDNGWDCDDIATENTLHPMAYLERPPNPRSWSLINLDVTLIGGFVQAIAKLLADEDNIPKINIVRCAMGLLAYFACEKIEGVVDSFYASELATALTLIMEKWSGDWKLVYTACMLISNLAWQSDPESYMQIRKMRNARLALMKAGKTYPNDGTVRDGDRRAAPSVGKRYVKDTLCFLSEKTADPTIFSPNMRWDYDLDLTEWNTEKFPNGVQDLPKELKEKIRDGSGIEGKSKLTALIEGPQGKIITENFFWKGSLDMKSIRWNIDKRPAANNFCKHSSFISQIMMVSEDPANSPHFAQQIADGKKVSGNFLILGGVPSETEPGGVRITLKFNTSGGRKSFSDCILDWREAATYGF